VRDAAQLLWMGEPRVHRLELRTRVAADDLEHPDELRVDLDPGPA